MPPYWNSEANCRLYQKRRMHRIRHNGICCHKIKKMITDYFAQSVFRRLPFYPAKIQNIIQTANIILQNSHNFSPNPIKFAQVKINLYLCTLFSPQPYTILHNTTQPYGTTECSFGGTHYPQSKRRTNKRVLG